VYRIYGWNSKPIPGSSDRNVARSDEDAGGVSTRDFEWPHQ
jgi:hypothetical protein